jgi:hypothetical protein
VTSSKRKEQEMNAKKWILGSALALCLSVARFAWAQGAPPAAPTEPSPAAALAQPETSAAGAAPVAAPASGPRPELPPGVAAQPAERRRTFWGAEPGRPYEETDSYVLPVLPIRFSGYAWIDAGYMELRTGKSGDYNQHANYEQGRFVLGASYRHDVGAYFAEARAQYVAFDNEFTKSQYEPHTQDAFLRVGGRLWDAQIGRFLAWEPYYRGNGIELYTAEENGAGGPTMYRLDYALGYADEAGQAAFHLYPADWLAFELASLYGQQLNQNNLGVRPVLALRGGGFLLIGGAEYVEQKPQKSNTQAKQTMKGAAARIAYTLRGTTLGAEGSWLDRHQRELDGHVNAQETYEKTTMGGYLESVLGPTVVGAGYHLTRVKDKIDPANKHHQAFVSLTYNLPIRGFSVKAVAGFARWEAADATSNATWDVDLKSIRVRLRYDFL